MGVHWVELRRRVALATCAATPNNREARARICLLGWCRAYHVAELRVSLVHGLVRGRQVGGRLEKGKQGLLHMCMHMTCACTCTCASKRLSARAGGWARCRVSTLRIWLARLPSRKIRLTTCVCGTASRQSRVRQPERFGVQGGQGPRQLAAVDLQLVGIELPQEVRGREGDRRCHKIEGWRIGSLKRGTRCTRGGGWG